MNLIRDYSTLQRKINESVLRQDSLRVALLSAGSATYDRFYKNTGLLRQLQDYLRECGVEVYLLFFEEDESVLQQLEEDGISGYNIDFADLEKLSAIEIFLSTEIIEFLSFCVFPEKSKVVIYPHNINYMLAHEPGGRIWEYWVAKAQSYDVDYLLLPSGSAILHSLPLANWESYFADTAPPEMLRGNEELTLVPFGYFDLDYGMEHIAQKREDLLPGVTEDDFIVLLSPLESGFEYILQDELLLLIDRLAAELTQAKIVVRPAPGDKVTENTLQSVEFAANVIIDDSIMSSEFVRYRPDLLIVEANSNIRLLYPLGYHIPVLEYLKGGQTEQVEQLSYGYRSGSYTAIVAAAKELAGNIQLQNNWRQRLQLFAQERVANYGCCKEYFFNMLADVKSGIIQEGWLKIRKNRDGAVLFGNPGQERFERILERNYKSHGSGYAILYYSKMIRKGFELYPDSITLNYYAGKLKVFSARTPHFAQSDEAGYYFQKILELSPQEFQRIHWQYHELAALIVYKLISGMEINEISVHHVMDKLLGAILPYNAGKKVIFELLMRYR